MKKFKNCHKEQRKTNTAIVWEFNKMPWVLVQYQHKSYTIKSQILQQQVGTYFISRRVQKSLFFTKVHTNVDDYHTITIAYLEMVFCHFD